MDKAPQVFFVESWGSAACLNQGLVRENYTEASALLRRTSRSRCSHSAFHFARDDGYTKVKDLLDIGRGVMKQGNSATDVEATDNHIHPGSAESPGKINSAWVLIGLYPHQAHHRFPAGSTAAPDNLGNVELMDGFVKEFNRYFEILTQRSTPLDIFSERIQTGQRIAWQHPSPMAQYIAIVIILRGFEQHDVEAANALRTLRDLTLIVSEQEDEWKAAS